MTRLTLIYRSFILYLRANLLVVFGVAISTAVLTGSLIIGDSVAYSLEQSALYRLGYTTHTVSTTDRYFRSQLAGELANKGGFVVASALMLDGIAITDGGKERVNKVQMTGIDNRFEKIAKSEIYLDLKDNEVIISRNLAERLHLKKGDNFIARIRKASLIPLNAPLVSDAETSVSFHATIKEIANQQSMGFFNLKNSQTAPYNLFLSLDKLNSLMKFTGKANCLLISAPKLDNQQISSLLDSCFTTQDAGLKVKEIPLLSEIEITSERVFIEDQIVKTFLPMKESHAILTYFANSINFNGNSTPYSFISTIDDNDLKDNDIIINNWIASDLKVKHGDTLDVKFFEIGPLRQLVEKSAKFIVKTIVPIEGKYADKDLMPSLPGLEGAGHCRDWDTGIPIRLESIRAKDEGYWNQYKGTPKAFISLKRAHEIWGNRFGNYTSIRINSAIFSDKSYKALFSASIKPANLGIVVSSVMDNGLKAAHNGVDFSQLFLGLSFFLLSAAIILTALIFLLNLESRQAEIGTLLMLGFSRNQIRTLFLGEGVLIAAAGALFGLLIAVIYTKLVFLALNSLWWDAVRISVLIPDIQTSTLLVGLIISILIATITILIAIYQNFKRQTVELQQYQDHMQSTRVQMIKNWVMVCSLILSVGLNIYQLAISGQINSSLFFVSGGLMLLGLLLLADFILRRNRQNLVISISLKSLNQRNRSQNAGRSLTIIILFALGTFLVVSTGANREDSISNIQKKSSGTGGYQYFAETTVPVLFSLNDRDRRLNEGIATPFIANQFSKIDGDDASCLNLNRATNPAILGADCTIFKDRFTFETKCAGIQNSEIWEALNRISPDGVVPAIADQTVIEWGLGKKIGDTITYRNSFGNPLKIILIAGLSPSVLQGYILISQANFLKNWPTNSGSQLFLINAEEKNAQKAGEELQSVFRDYGWEMTTASQRLVEFNSVTNTYLSIFLALGALGLILGTVGLAVVLARSLLERNSEMVLLQSLGFTRRQIVILLVREYGVLLIWGVLIGFISSVVAVFPTFLSAESSTSFITVILIVAIIIANGICWIIGLSRYSVRQNKQIVNRTYR